MILIFQSTPPVKAATDFYDGYKIPATISIHAAREGGDAADSELRLKWLISIHAAREGGDVVPLGTGTLSLYISIHAAREGGDVGCFGFTRIITEFQSTPPVKAATKAA